MKDKTSQQHYRWMAMTAFGLEGLAARGLRGMGMRDVECKNGIAYFTGTAGDALRANMRLTVSDRVLLLAGRFSANTFAELYDNVYALDWAAHIPRNGSFPVTGKCVRSQLMSVSDVQRITKKAIVEKLRAQHRVTNLPESGTLYRVDVSIHSDIATLTLNSSGDALNRRGYRTWNADAPLRETLAAAMLELSPWKPGMPLYDPMCGSGTILIEAALMRTNIAPGSSRAFDIENWNILRREDAHSIREEINSRALSDTELNISGSDIDNGVIKLAKLHAKAAGLFIPLSVCDARDVQLPEGAHIVTNPPYGQRSGDKKSAESAIRALKKLYVSGAASLTVITPHAGFERIFGKRAASRRRVYNGRLECEILIFT